MAGSKAGKTMAREKIMHNNDTSLIRSAKNETDDLFMVYIYDSFDGLCRLQQVDPESYKKIGEPFRIPISDLLEFYRLYDKNNKELLCL